MTSETLERSPKRQRRSYSPASPPETETKPFVLSLPQTPPPSVHMSPTTTSFPATSTAANSATGGTESRGGGVTFPTPPSTAGFQSQGGPGSGRFGSEGGDGESRGQTPNSGQRDGEGDIGMGEADAEVGNVKAEDAEHRRTDHEREATRMLTDIPPPPRLYRLSAQSVPPSRPSPSQNVLELYSLTAIQHSVARRDSAGNKINKLRKSYEGKIKALGLEGRSRPLNSKSEPKVEKDENGRPVAGPLEKLILPHLDMEVQEGRTMWEGMMEERPSLSTVLEESSDGLGAAADYLAPALSGMRKGALPKSEAAHWSSILGLDEVAKPAVPGGLRPNGVGAGAVNPVLGKLAGQQRTGVSAPASPSYSAGGGVQRPERVGKKRRYDDASFEGYEEGYSTGGENGGVGKRVKVGGGGRG